jgi:hypothetical protein
MPKAHNLGVQEKQNDRSTVNPHPETNTKSILRGGVMRSKSGLGAYILIALGIIFLLSNLGWLPHLGPLMARGWPLILIIAGVLLLIRRSSHKKL